MNRWMITLLALVFALGMQAQNIEYSKEDSALVVKLLKEAPTQRGNENRIFYFGKKFLGLPYVAHTLELGDTEHLIVNLHGLDCTTFVETVVALSMCDQQWWHSRCVTSKINARLTTTARISRKYVSVRAR